MKKNNYKIFSIIISLLIYTYLRHEILKSIIIYTIKYEPINKSWKNKYNKNINNNFNNQSLNFYFHEHQWFIQKENVNMGKEVSKYKLKNVI